MHTKDGQKKDKYKQNAHKLQTAEGQNTQDTNNIRTKWDSIQTKYTHTNKIRTTYRNNNKKIKNKKRRQGTDYMHTTYGRNTDKRRTRY